MTTCWHPQSYSGIIDVMDAHDMKSSSACRTHRTGIFVHTVVPRLLSDSTPPPETLLCQRFPLRNFPFFILLLAYNARMYSSCGHYNIKLLSVNNPINLRKNYHLLCPHASWRQHHPHPSSWNHQNHNHPH